MFVLMIGYNIQQKVILPVEFVIVDMSDCYTWSFPEFLPFCLHLYYYSSFKDFNTVG